MTFDDVLDGLVAAAIILAPVGIGLIFTGIY